MQTRITLDDVADGATRLVLGDDGAASASVHVVSLDEATPAALAAAGRALATGRHAVLVGVSDRAVPDTVGTRAMLDHLDVVLAPVGPWRHVGGTASDLDAVVAGVLAAPHAALVLVDVLRTASHLDVPQALVVESLAYSTLWGGAEFGAWRASAPAVAPSTSSAEPVGVRRTDHRLDIQLRRPERHNAFDRALRDALVEALAVAEADPTIDEVLLSGAGPSFSSGGDLAEFGSSSDLATAHLVRSVQSPAAAVHRLAPRVRCILHGACIGAGIEVPSFAGRVQAVSGTWFQLPELRYGLIPGAGGTVGISRRVGRWRTAFLALTGCRLELDTALAWGLVDGRV
jgi:hypothetical protein